MDKKRISKRYLSLFLALIMLIGIMPTNIFAEDPSGPAGEPVAVPGGTSARAVDTPDWDISSKEEETDYWPLTVDNRLVEVSGVEPVKNPTIEYGGSYNLTDENSKIREVVTINFRTSAGDSALWRRLLLKFDADLDQMIDWNNNQTGAWKIPQTNQSATTTINFNNGIQSFTSEPVANVGSKHVHSLPLENTNGVKYKVPAIEAPMHFVLRDPDELKAENLPSTIKELTQKKEPIVQARLVDLKYKRVYTIPSKHLNSYSTYTTSTIIPNKNYRAGLIPESQEDNASIQFVDGAPWATAQNAFISYNKNAPKPYVDLTIRHTKNGIGLTGLNKIIGLRTVLEERFFNTLLGSAYKKDNGENSAEDNTAHIADVFLVDVNEEPYGPNATYKNPLTERCIPVLRNQINNSEDGLKFIQVAGNEYQKTKEEEKLSINSNGNAYDTVVNRAPSLGNAGVGTVVRFYVIPEKFEKLVGNSDLLNMSFYTTFTRQTKIPRDVFTGKVDKDRKYKQGDVLVLDPGVKKALSRDKKMVLEVGQRPHSMIFQHYNRGAFKTPLQQQKGGNAYTWTIPYDMTLKADTPIKLYAEGLDKRVKDFRFYTNETQQGLGDTGDFFTIKRDSEKTGDMQFMRFVENLKAPNVTKTQNEASIPEIFTTDNIIYGHTQLGQAIVRARGLGENDKLLNQAYLSDENDTYKDVGSGDNADSIIDKKNSQIVIVNKKIYTGYEFSTKEAINPKDPLGDGKGVENKKYKLEKDTPLAFTIEDYSVNAIEKLPPIIEQVQAKVNFDLNGGYLGDDPAADKAKDPIIKIAPLNEKYKYVVDEDKFPTATPNPDYKANAFVGDNRRMVYPLKDDGNGKLVPDTSAQKVMASHTDQPLGTETYQDAFNRYNDQLKRALTEAEALPTGIGTPNTIRNAAITEAKQDIESFKKYIERFYTSKGIDITKSQLWLREFPGKESQAELKTADPKNEEQGKVFLGWSTRKLTQEEADKFGSMPELTDVKQWADVDATPVAGQTTKAYKFTENSPIDKERTVYAVWGKAAIILHSNVMENGVLKDTTVIIPFTNEDKEYTENRIDTMSGATVTKSSKENLKKNSTVKQIPLVPYKFDSQSSSYDPRFTAFAQTRSTFVGWTTTQYQNDAKSNFKAGLNNSRLADLDEGKVADTGNQKKSFLKKAEMLTYLQDNPIVSYLPNGMDLYIHESLDEIIKNGKQIHLYANYRPYFYVNVKPRYMDITGKDYGDADKDGNYGEYADTVLAGKKHDINVALLYRTAVTDYSDPTVAQTATYNAINEADLISGDKLIKPFAGTSTETLTWSVPGFDKDGKRLSYVAMVFPKGKTEADYKAFDETKWKDFGITVNVRKIIDWDKQANANVPKNLHRDAGDVYGGNLAKTQVFTETPDTFTSATSRKSDIRQGSTNEVNGYTIVMTNTPESLTKPIIKTLFNTDTSIKLDTSNVDVNDVKTITLRVPTTGTNFTTYTFTKNESGTFVCNDTSITATVDAATKEITISSFALTDLANKFVHATYANDAVTSEEGNEMIQKRLASNEVTDFEQVENKDGKPVVEMTIPGGSGNPSNPSKGTKYVVEKYDKDADAWVAVSDEYVMTAEDRPGDKLKLDITGTVKHDNKIRIVAKELNKTDTESQKSIKLDLAGPAVTGEAKDDAFRMFIDIKAILDELPKEGTLKIEVGTKGVVGTEGNMIIDNIDPTKETDTKYLVERLSKIPRESIKGMWVSAEDKFGNKTENKLLPYNPTKQIEVQYLNFRANRSTFYMFIEGTDYTQAQAQLTVIRGSQEINLDFFDITNVNTRYKLTKDSKAFKLQKDDILKIYAVATDGAYTNPHEITIK